MDTNAPQTWHVSPDGDPGVCTAKIRACPYGGMPHGATEKEVLRAYELLQGPAIGEPHKQSAVTSESLKTPPLHDSVAVGSPHLKVDPAETLRAAFGNWDGKGDPEAVYQYNENNSMRARRAFGATVHTRSVTYATNDVQYPYVTITEERSTSDYVRYGDRWVPESQLSQSDLQNYYGVAEKNSIRIDQLTSGLNRRESRINEISKQSSFGYFIRHFRSKNSVLRGLYALQSNDHSELQTLKMRTQGTKFSAITHIVVGHNSPNLDASDQIAIKRTRFKDRSARANPDNPNVGWAYRLLRS